MFCSNLKPQSIEFSIKHTYSTSARRSQKDWPCKSRGMTINELVSKHGTKGPHHLGHKQFVVVQWENTIQKSPQLGTNAKFPMAVVVKTNCTNNKFTQSSIIKYIANAREVIYHLESL